MEACLEALARGYMSYPEDLSVAERAYLKKGPKARLLTSYAHFEVITSHQDFYPPRTPPPTSHHLPLVLYCGARYSAAVYVRNC